MLSSIVGFNLKKAVNAVDWRLLLFLLLFLDVKLAVKIAAIILIYALRFDFKFGFSFKNSRLPLFYLLIMLIPFVSLVFTGGYSNPDYLIVFFTGLGFWLLCILAVHQVKLAVENDDPEIIHRTILAFFVINAIISFGNYGAIVWETHAINPYRYQGQHQKYFIGTGDYIRGLTFDTSTTNAVLNAAGVIYFMIRKNNPMVLICMIVLLFTGSNFTNMALFFVLALLFIFNSSRDQKSLIMVCVMLLVVFMAQVSPQNDKYALNTISLAFHPPVPRTNISNVRVVCGSSPNQEETRQQIAKNYLDSISRLKITKTAAIPFALASLPRTSNGRIFIDTPKIHTAAYQSVADTTTGQHVLLDFIAAHKAQLPLSSVKIYRPGKPGKVISFLQTADFLVHNPVKLIAGAGMGNFSSKLAFRVTSFGFAGGYPTKHTYINNNFLSNHLDVYLNFFSKRAGFHSLINSPNSVYDQLLSEYGLAGLAAFAIFYVWFFARHTKGFGYGLPLLLLLLMIFFTDYWFEQLSVVVFFELLFFLNIREIKNNTQPIYAS
ncbi:hypothetical protein [Mucilaginibacter sp. L3T2-6]|uniref:hypothetical protein n=1 Tax=Mucilaginibacter sp. L3T2-6 TaxID=3062491 RepID=UPI002676275B|nr:hypothetical protein [Mucilaginibacter sp. L3T2-6]MDO3643398.1 hypothetical protein [Mucilaginibacter sp. L3T2-6]MDV6215669.1 hypothetical protein [Mucilaginibacter sp. L3T2-6]